MAANPSAGAEEAIDLSGDATMPSEIADMVGEATAAAVDPALPTLVSQRGRQIKRRNASDYVTEEPKRGRK